MNDMQHTSAWIKIKCMIQKEMKINVPKINSQGKPNHHLLKIFEKCSDICPCGTISSTWCISPLLALDHFWHSANAVDIEGAHFLQSSSASLHGEKVVAFPGTGRGVVSFSPGQRTACWGRLQGLAVALAMANSPQSQPPKWI